MANGGLPFFQRYAPIIGGIIASLITAAIALALFILPAIYKAGGNAEVIHQSIDSITIRLQKIETQLDELRHANGEIKIELTRLSTQLDFIMKEIPVSKRR